MALRNLGVGLRKIRHGARKFKCDASEIYVVEVIGLIEVKEIACRNDEIVSSVAYFVNKISQIFVDLKNVIKRNVTFQPK